MELGLTEEQADKVLAKYVNTIPKHRFDEVNEDLLACCQSCAGSACRRLSEVFGSKTDAANTQIRYSRL